MEGLSPPNEKRRPVGLERRYRRHERLAQAIGGCPATVRQARRARRASAWRPALTPDQAGNLRRGALVAPAHRRFLEDYILSSESLGAGMSGDVLLAQLRGADGRAHGSHVAVKTLTKIGDGSLQYVEQEVNMYLNLDHVNIAQLLQVYYEDDKVYLVMECCSGGSVGSRLKQKGVFSEQEAIDCLRQLLIAIRYCHARPGGALCHRDLKPDNLVYASTAQDAPLKLVDFGLSAVARPGQLLKDCAGTLDYVAPEVLAREGHNERCDMWAVGAIAHRLLCGKPPFTAEKDAEVARLIVAAQPVFEESAWGSVSQPARDFVQRLLQRNPADRLTAAQALRHPWLADEAAPAAGAGACLPLQQCGEAVQKLYAERLQSFASMSALRRACCAMAVYGHVLSPEGLPADEEVRIAEELFRALDRDGDGAIDQEEFTSVATTLKDMEPEACKSVFERLDLTGEKRIERSQFLAAVVGSRLLKCDMALRSVFDRFDADGSGHIDRAEMQAVLGERFCGDSVGKIFTEVDSNSDSTIDIAEFRSAVVASTTH